MGLTNPETQGKESAFSNSSQGQQWFSSGCSCDPFWQGRHDKRTQRRRSRMSQWSNIFL